MVSENKVKTSRGNFAARKAVLAAEESQEYLELLAALNAEHQPSGPLEEFCVHQMLSAQWRLLRTARIERGLLTTSREFGTLLRYEDMLRRAFYKALDTLRRAKARRPDPPSRGAGRRKPVPVPSERPPVIVLRRRPAAEPIRPEATAPREPRARFRAAALPPSA